MSDSPMQIRSDISSVLAQMRALRENAGVDLQRNMAELDRAPQAAAPVQDSFSGLLANAINSVNDLQQDASARSSAFVRGESDDLVGVMIAGQKASVGFQALNQVRNRVVSAYQDIMNMPI